VKKKAIRCVGAIRQHKSFADFGEFDLSVLEEGGSPFLNPKS